MSCSSKLSANRLYSWQRTLATAALMIAALWSAACGTMVPSSTISLPDLRQANITRIDAVAPLQSARVYHIASLESAAFEASTSDSHLLFSLTANDEMTYTTIYAVNVTQPAQAPQAIALAKTCAGRFAQAPDSNTLLCNSGATLTVATRTAPLKTSKMQWSRPSNWGVTNGDLAWSPDGKYLTNTYATGQGCDLAILTLAPATMQVSQRLVVSLDALLKQPRYCQATLPSWSPDGQWLAFVVKDGASPDPTLYVTPTAALLSAADATSAVPPPLALTPTAVKLIASDQNIHYTWTTMPDAVSVTTHYGHEIHRINVATGVDTTLLASPKLQGSAARICELAWLAAMNEMAFIVCDPLSNPTDGPAPTAQPDQLYLLTPSA